MTRKPTTREKIEALTLARKAIRYGHQSWICWALRDVARDSIRLRPAVEHLEKYITAALEHGNKQARKDPIPTLMFWVRRYRPELARDNKHMKQYRLQWIDWMIGCLADDLAKENK